MSDPRGLKAALIQASAAIASSNQYEKSKTEERLGRIGAFVLECATMSYLERSVAGDGVQQGVQIATVGGALSVDNTQEALNFVKSKIDSFMEDSKYAIKVLDEIGKIHPFIQGKLSSLSIVTQSHTHLRSGRIRVQGCTEFRTHKTGK